MDQPLLSSLLKGRRPWTCLDAVFRLPEPEEDGDDGGFVDDDRWGTVAVSAFRILACFLATMATTLAWAVGGHAPHASVALRTDPAGQPLRACHRTIDDEEARALCTGQLDAEIIWYPLFGQLYVLANHLRIDRSNPAAAIESLKEAARAVMDNNLSLIIFPEGTRSRSGRLLPFKKGFIHIALQTQLSIVPMIFTGTHLAWRKGSLRVRPAPITVKYLPPMETNDWKAENMNEYIELIRTLYVKHLPECQKPLTFDVG